MNTAWHTVASAKVVLVPIGERPNKKGEMKTIFARTGISVTMANGDKWFYHFRARSWTHHWMGIDLHGVGFNAAPKQVERKQTYSLPALRREYDKRPAMLAALEEGEMLAYAEEAAKRAA